MAALTSLSDLVNRMTGGNSGTPENIFLWKLPFMAGVNDTWAAGIMYSAWRYDGYPGAGATPTTVAAPTSATAGAIPFTNSGGIRSKWLVQAQFFDFIAVNSITSLILYDRLLHIGSLDATVITAQTVAGTLTRNTGGEGNMIFIETYAAIGTTARTITASYTNQAGTAGRTTTAVAYGASTATYGNEVNQMFALPLQSGDTGVRSVESVTLSASTGTAGNFGVTIGKPLGTFSFRGAEPDFTIGLTGMPEIVDDACLAFIFTAMSTTESGFHGMLATVEA